jgi:hypothetical protein
MTDSPALFLGCAWAEWVTCRWRHFFSPPHFKCRWSIVGDSPYNCKKEKNPNSIGFCSFLPFRVIPSTPTRQLLPSSPTSPASTPPGGGGLRRRRASRHGTCFLLPYAPREPLVPRLPLRRLWRRRNPSGGWGQCRSLLIDACFFWTVVSLDGT